MKFEEIFVYIPSQKRKRPIHFGELQANMSIIWFVEITGIPH